MARPSINSVQHAYDVIDAYGRALALLAKARAEVDAEPEHAAEYDCGINHPLDGISTVEAALEERIEALRMWLGVHDRDEAA